MQPPKLELFAMVAWLVWCRQNEIISNEPCLPPHKILESIRNFLFEFKRKTWVQVHRPSLARSKWKPLDAPKVKANFDRVMFVESSEAGISVVIRNENKEIMVALFKKIAQPLLVETLETLAATQNVL